LWLAAAGFAAPALAEASGEQFTASEAVVSEAMAHDAMQSAAAASMQVGANSEVASNEADSNDLAASNEADSMDLAASNQLAANNEAGANDEVAVNNEEGANKEVAANNEVAASNWARVDDSALDGARGGFTIGNGLTVSLGIDRLVSINGDAVSHTRIDVADLGRIGGEAARQTSEALSSVKLIQNGSANIYNAGESSASMAGLVIQNSLSNQLIRTETVISSTVNSAGLLNALNFQGTLQDAVNHAVSQR
jgi:hypothetical protein